MSKLGVFHFQFLHLPLPLLIAFPQPWPCLPLHETPPNPPHLDSAVLTTTDNKGALQPVQRVKVRGGVISQLTLSRFDQIYLDMTTAPIAWVWPVPMATHSKTLVLLSILHSLTVLSFDPVARTRPSWVELKLSTIPECPLSS